MKNEKFKIKAIFLFFIFFGIFSSSSYSQTINSFFDEADSFFKTYVVNGRVNYKAIKENEADLDKVLTYAKNLNVSENNVTAYQAFWINAYNLAVIKGIINEYPINSPLDKKGFFDSIKYDLGKISITLNDIENKMLRAKFDDARFHFVLVCGARGCPPLISKAYMPDTLNQDLEKQTKLSLNNNAFIKVKKGGVILSQIFKWYKEDFIKNGKTEIDFLNKYRIKKLPKETIVTYYSYNWQLNSQ